MNSAPAPRFEIGSAVRPADGFASGGDAVVTRTIDGTLLLAILDVLGHGPQAHTVAARAEELLEHTEVADAPALLRMLDEELAGSLGAAAGVAVLSMETGGGCFVGIGNTVARIIGSADRRLLSIDGVIGHRHGTPRPVSFEVAAGEVLVLHTDGITSRFSDREYPRLRTEDVKVAARELVRRFGKSHDDVGCIVVRRVS